ncbi:Co2+/Mg2+ efflux protein ApaG [Flavobacterium agricola]|uniref:Co2+/Mg2+ efflux protein ApaG n=1 Tax=Flavobacterium agricola TaxID=2870839 RepID=A0ABY6LZ65_9FLAO|nr:Co2+/Mg2+ efflux protein ApaG [Flavobacterium agricola]UYW00699.1 Co2+/Mg2+ efflux protein ApaG [Flavobacterium agricola]
MVSQITNGIKVSVKANYIGSSVFNNYKVYNFTYRITIDNNSNDTAQLVTRHWEILDALNPVKYVDGVGVIGKKPIIKPGESYSYESYCSLFSPFGAMLGFYSMINLATATLFEVTIPRFKLYAPFAIN